MRLLNSQKLTNTTLVAFVLLCLFCMPALSQQASSASTTTNDSDLTTLKGNRALWPREVSLTRAVEFPVISGGKEIGTLELPVGTLVKLVDITGAQVKVIHMATTNVIASESTDLLARVEALRAARRKAAVTPSPAKVDSSLVAVTIVNNGGMDLSLSIFDNPSAVKLRLKPGETRVIKLTKGKYSIDAVTPDPKDFTRMKEGTGGFMRGGTIERPETWPFQMNRNDEWTMFTRSSE
ncbi:MAG: hypothetical protein PCFJNLEI_02032 [Verrucomicrobiae bacterium]|nr:hypothetical protein [Verrucomicrobiae bacterium]